MTSTDKISVAKIGLFALVPLLLFSGVLYNPLLAVFVTAMYEIGLVGLVLMYNSRFTEKPLIDLIAGFIFLLLASVTLYFLVQIAGFW